MPPVTSPEEMRVVDYQFEPPSGRSRVRLLGDGSNPDLELITVTKDADETEPPNKDAANGTYTPGTRRASVTAGFKSGPPSSTWDNLMARLDRNVDFVAELRFTGSGTNRTVTDLNFKDAPPQLAHDPLRSIQRDMRAIRDIVESALGDGQFEIVVRRKHPAEGQHRDSEVRGLSPQPKTASEG